MHLPIWMIGFTLAIGVVGIVWLCLLLRRVLTELFFWRGAYRCTNERVAELLESAEEQALMKHYEAAVGSIVQEAMYRRIDWVSQADEEYFRTHHGPVTGLADVGGSASGMALPQPLRCAHSEALERSDRAAP